MKHLFIAVVMFTAIPNFKAVTNDEPAWMQKQPLMCPKGWIRLSTPEYYDFKESVEDGFKYYKTISKKKRVLVGIEIFLKDIGKTVIYWDKAYL